MHQITFIQVRKNNKKSTQQTLKVKVILKNPNAKSEETEEAAKVKMVSIKQTAYDEAIIELDAEATTTPSIDTIKMVETAAKEGADPVEKTYQVKNVTLSADKKSITVVYDYAESRDTVTYSYTFTDSNLDGEVSFTTGKYDVDKVVVDDQEVEAGVLSRVYYKLYSTDGIDVTNYTADWINDVAVEFEGDSIQDQNTSAAKPQILLPEVGNTAKMTVTYKVSATAENGMRKDDATIKAVKPTATNAKAIFRQTDTDKSYTDQLFYLDKDTSVSTVEMYSSASYNTKDQSVWFYGQADNADKAIGYYAVAYEGGVTVSSSNENVVTASVSSATKKLAEITLSPANAGSATITVTALEIKGSTECPFTATFVVRVKDFNNNAAKLVGDSSVVITNAVDDNYSKEATFKLQNSDNEDVEGSYSIEVVDGKGNPDPDNVNVELGDKKVTITAPGADPGTYRINVEAEGENHSDVKVFKKTIYVRVEDVSGAVANKLKYEIELDKSALSLSDTAADTKATISIAANMNGKFVGYVRRRAKVLTNLDESAVSGDNLTDLGYYVGSKGESGIKVNISPKIVIQTPNGKYSGFDRSTVSGDGVYDATFYMNVSYSISEDAWLPDGYDLNNIDGKSKVLATANINPAGYVYFFGNSANSKNYGIAPSGTYGVTVYESYEIAGNTLKNTKVLATRKNITVSYNLTMPYVDYDRSSSADFYAASSVDFFEDVADQSNWRYTYKESSDDKNPNHQSYAAAKAAIDKIWTGVNKDWTNVFSAWDWINFAEYPIATEVGEKYKYYDCEYKSEKDEWVGKGYEGVADDKVEYGYYAGASSSVPSAKGTVFATVIRDASARGDYNDGKLVKATDGSNFAGDTRVYFVVEKTQTITE